MRSLTPHPSAESHELASTPVPLPAHEVRDLANHGHEWVVDADIQDCFGAIDHAKLLRVIEQRVNDRRVLKLLRKWLEAGVMVDGEVIPSTGTARGNPISPLLANAFLHWLDRLWKRRGGRLGELVRYCDDLVILCRTEAQARDALSVC